MPVVTALEFLAATLISGLGLFLASEALIRLRRHFVLRGISHGLAAVGGVAAALSGGYWATIIVRW